ncbi:MAG: HAMP domain-containing sensor histidine kinase [Nannocystaceae bacterium]
MTPGFEELERRAHLRAFSLVSRGRLVVLVSLTVFATWLGLADDASWRRLVLGGLLIGLLGIDLVSRWRIKRFGMEPGITISQYRPMAIFQVSIVLATGGLASPALPVLLPTAFLSGLALGKAGVRRVVLGLHFPALALFAILHLTDWLPSLVPAPFRWEGAMPMTYLAFSGVTVALLVFVFGMFGARMRGEARRQLEQLNAAQHSALALHRQRLDELQQMSGEIAHELKNPLASVKGLAQLLRRSNLAEQPKAAERLGVLEREVIRMQSILDEFLTFSRPLTPLTRTNADLGALCRDVVVLHEAMSAALGVVIRLELESDSALWIDARKVSQALVNLLQNALEATRPGTVVILRVRPQPEGVVFEVIDQGPGVSTELAGAVFDPGVTSKAEGNGLGLTISRGIAEQHGGSLELHDQASGGCIARMWIPRQAQETA